MYISYNFSPFSSKTMLHHCGVYWGICTYIYKSIDGQTNIKTFYTQLFLFFLSLFLFCILRKVFSCSSCQSWLWCSTIPARKDKSQLRSKDVSFTVRCRVLCVCVWGGGICLSISVNVSQSVHLCLRVCTRVVACILSACMLMCGCMHPIKNLIPEQ